MRRLIALVLGRKPGVPQKAIKSAEAELLETFRELSSDDKTVLLHVARQLLVRR